MTPKWYVSLEPVEPSATDVGPTPPGSATADVAHSKGVEILRHLIRGRSLISSEVGVEINRLSRWRRSPLVIMTPSGQVDSAGLSANFTIQQTPHPPSHTEGSTADITPPPTHLTQMVTQQTLYISPRTSHTEGNTADVPPQPI